MVAHIKAIKKSIKTMRGRVWDVIFSPLTLVSSLWFRKIRHFSLSEMPFSKRVFEVVGIFPLKDHYYELLINRKSLDREFRNKRRVLPIFWNEKEQLDLLNQFDVNEELAKFPRHKTKKKNIFMRTEILVRAMPDTFIP